MSSKELSIKIGNDIFIYKKFSIKISNDIFNTKSFHPTGEILMDVDFRKHPAWNREAGNVVNQSNESVSRFNNRFSGLSFNVPKKKESKN